MNVDVTKIMDLLRDDAAEDYLGLYEIVWTLNTLYPEVPEREKIVAALPVVARALSEGSHKLFVTIGWPPAQYEQVVDRLAPEIIRHEWSWQVPSGHRATLYWIARM